jgi:hypothetical protein
LVGVILKGDWLGNLFNGFTTGTPWPTLLTLLERPWDIGDNDKGAACTLYIRWTVGVWTIGVIGWFSSVLL